MEIPLKALEMACSAAKHILPPDFDEPDEVPLLVEKHRWFWKPEHVRTILIAESHVYTSLEDLKFSVKPGCLSPAFENAPSEYVRLVYCLGYGESKILEHKSGMYPPIQNSGTPQFWKLFARLAGMDPHLVAKTYTTLGQRLENKLQVLEILKRKGIWLLDASVHAIYNPGKEPLNLNTKIALHQSWWEHYGSVIVGGFNPKDIQIWVIGKSVHQALSSAQVATTDWIYQPQAKLPTHIHEARVQRLIIASNN